MSMVTRSEHNLSTCTDPRRFKEVQLEGLIKDTPQPCENTCDTCKFFMSRRLSAWPVCSYKGLWMLWHNIGTVTLAMPGMLLEGGAKWHLFLKIRLKDGRWTKNAGSQKESNLTTVNRQTNYRGYNKGRNNDGPIIIGGDKSLRGRQ